MVTPTQTHLEMDLEEVVDMFDENVDKKEILGRLEEIVADLREEIRDGKKNR